LNERLPRPRQYSYEGGDEMTLHIGRVVLAGLVGTAAMTALMLMSPLMGLPTMDIGRMLGSMIGGNIALGWVSHFMIGVVLAFAYAFFFVSRIPGPGLARGAIYGLLPWLAAQLVVMPMMGAGFFSGSVAAAVGSLIGHLVYGGVIGAVYGVSDELAVAPRHVHA
jgi:uncharacterized membrane protein YagU involved in acid resistance